MEFSGTQNAGAFNLNRITCMQNDKMILATAVIKPFIYSFNYTGAVIY